MLKHETESKMLLRLVWAAVHPEADQTVAVETGCDLKTLTGVMVRQSLVTLLYPVIAKQTGEFWRAVQKQLNPVYEQEAHKGLIQEYEIQTLLDEMEQDGIDCLPMKGWVMRNYYPEPLMRSMGDLDVLIKDMDSRKMQDWMEARGYEAVKVDRVFHDEYRKLPCMYVELHRTLMDKRWLQPSEIQWLDKITPDFWREDALTEGKQHLFRLSDELFYVHHISHFYKHFTESGVGLRPLIDLYFFLKEKGDSLNWDYINQQLEQLHLTSFCRQMEKIARAWLAEQLNLDSQAMIVMGYLTGVGIYGSWSTQEALRVAQGKQAGKSTVRQVMERCFLPLADMCKIYPSLQKYPILLPICWLRRIIKVVLFQNYKLTLLKSARTKEKQEDIEAIYSAAGIGKQK